MPDNIYKGPVICGSYWAEQYGWKEGWWYVWNEETGQREPLRPATEAEHRAGDGAQ